MISFSRRTFRNFSFSLDKQPLNTQSPRVQQSQIRDVLPTMLFARLIDNTIERLSRTTRWSYPERGIETTPAWRRAIRHVKVVRATNLSLCVLREAESRLGDRFLRTKLRAQSFKRFRRFPRRRRRDRRFDGLSRYRENPGRRREKRISQTAGTLTCVACVYYPLVCRWSSEARRRIARVSPGGSLRSIPRRLRNPLSSTDPLRSSGTRKARSRTPSWRVHLRGRR